MSAVTKYAGCRCDCTLKSKYTIENQKTDTDKELQREKMPKQEECETLVKKCESSKHSKVLETTTWAPTKEELKKKQRWGVTKGRSQRNETKIYTQYRAGCYTNTNLASQQSYVMLMMVKYCHIRQNRFWGATHFTLDVPDGSVSNNV